MDRADILFEHYKIHLDLYKHYLDMIIKFNLFYYAITGAILSFYFANRAIAFIQYILIFPFAMSLIFFLFFCYASKKAKNSREEIFNLGRILELNVVPELSILTILLKLFATLFGIVSLLLIITIILHNKINC